MVQFARGFARRLDREDEARHAAPMAAARGLELDTVREVLLQELVQELVQELDRQRVSPAATGGDDPRAVSDLSEPHAARIDRT